MQILKPSFYNHFVCTGNHCAYTCCQNWKITVDKTTYLKYKSVQAPISTQFKHYVIPEKHAKSTQTYAHIKLQDKKCPFLNSDHLCNIYIELGESYMCNTCKLFPRILKNFNDFYELYLDLSCPEVVKFLMAPDATYTFDVVEDTLSPLELSAASKVIYNPSTFNILFEARLLFINYIQNPELPFKTKLLMIKLAADQFQTLLDDNIDSSLPSLLNLLKQLPQDQTILQQFDLCTLVPKTRTHVLNTLFQIKSDRGISDPKLYQILESLNTFYHQNNFERFKEIYLAFDHYFTSKTHLFENLLVNYLYTYILSALKDKNIDEKVFTILTHYAAIKQLLIAQWWLNNEVLTDDQIILTISAFHREFTHDLTLSTSVYNTLKADGYTQLDKIAMII